MKPSNNISDRLKMQIKISAFGCLNTSLNEINERIHCNSMGE